MKLHHVCVLKTWCFPAEKNFLNIHEGAVRWVALDAAAVETSSSHFCQCRTNGNLAVRYIHFMDGLRIGLPRTCVRKLHIPQMSNVIGKSFLTFENYQAKYHSLFCISWYSIFLYFGDFWFRNTGQEQFYATNIILVWITHYSPSREWIYAH